MIKLSNDGYVRLTLATLRNTSLTHFISGLDEEYIDPKRRQHDGLGEISGYTEWVSTAEPVITIGWDWHLMVSGQKFQYDRVCPPRSNLMLVDRDNGDLGPAQTQMLLGDMLDTIDWQREAFNAISERYPSATCKG